MMGIVFAFYLDGRLGVSVIVMGGAKWMTGISGFGRGQFDWNRGGRIW